MALTKVTSGVRTLGTGEVTAANLASGVVDTSGLEDDVALLGFKVASNGSLAKYNLVDQTVDDFQDTSGVDASSSTNETRDSSGKYYQATVTLTTYASKGGGAGGNVSAGAGQDGVDGGAGGGGGTQPTGNVTTSGGTSNKNTYSGWLSYGTNGGTGNHSAGLHEAGGGGGGGNSAGTNGSNSSGVTAGAGAVGYETDISGSSTYYSGGGGGSQDVGSSGGAGGNGGGGAYNTNGTANTGGGGGGGTSPGDGGSGIVIFDDGTTVSSFTADGTFTVPAGKSQVDVFEVGGGGPGGYGSSTGGGGSGQVLRHTTLGVTAGDQWTVTIGAGGIATSVGNDTMGTNGEDTSIALNAYAANMTLVSTTTAAQAAPTKGDVVFTYTNGAGTTTLDTDVTAEISADGGSTWTAMTLGSEGSTGAHNIATSHDVTISSTITAPYNMAYRIKTLNQAVGKTTRIQAVSLGWS